MHSVHSLLPSVCLPSCRQRVHSGFWESPRSLKRSRVSVRVAQWNILGNASAPDGGIGTWRRQLGQLMVSVCLAVCPAICPAVCSGCCRAVWMSCLRHERQKACRQGRVRGCWHRSKHRAQDTISSSSANRSG